MPAVHYLGPEGTFSHILARRRFGRRADLAPCATIEAVFDRVKESPGALGLVPIENSSGGTVYDTADLLIRHADTLRITEELALDIRIALLGRNASDIRTVYSHFTQIKHHADWLKAHFPKAKVRAVASTALAAEKAAQSRGAAALASPGAAEIYGLKVLETPRSAAQVNVTHFFVIGREERPPAAGPRKTALVAALPNVCGSLHRFLGPFARQRVSLTRIVSRPVPGKPQTYVFFLEIEGGPADAQVGKALAGARKMAGFLRPLGTFSVGRRYRS